MAAGVGDADGKAVTLLIVLEVVSSALLDNLVCPANFILLTPFTSFLISMYALSRLISTASGEWNDTRSLTYSLFRTTALLLSTRNKSASAPDIATSLIVRVPGLLLPMYKYSLRRYPSPVRAGLPNESFSYSLCQISSVRHVRRLLISRISPWPTPRLYLLSE